MYLKKIELIGFKSFADKMEFQFAPGISALVGPNGCGKSNVVDAIKWVLGEQGPKSLRSSEMTDVIFNGTANRQATNFAQVVLAFDNADRSLAVDCDEVCIMRRVYRSGEGEYYINGERCRLKDIKELFMDTGIGMHAYSIIEQGRVDLLLNANSAQRRSIFDEAAGISKYKAKKHEAANKLERVQNNLLRLEDIIAEVEKQLRSVKYQAAKARRFREYKERLDTLRISYFLNDYNTSKAKKEQRQQTLRQRLDQRDALSAEIEKLGAQTNELENTLHTMETERSALLAKQYEIDSLIKRAEDRIAFNTTRQSEIRGEMDSAASVMRDLEKKCDEYRTEADELRMQTEGLEHGLEELATALGEKEALLNEEKAKQAQFEKTLDDKKNMVMEVFQKTSKVQNEIASINSSVIHLANNKNRMESRIAEIERQKEDLEAKIRQCAGESDGVTRRQAEIETAVADKVKEETAIRATLDALNTEITEKRARLSQLKTRYELLVELESNMEGVNTAAKEILSLAEGAAPKLKGVKGLLADFVEIDADYVNAIEVALADRCDAVVTEDVASAFEVIDYLKETRKGKVSLLPLELVREKLESFTDSAGADQSTRASGVVRGNGMEKYFKNILSSTVIVETLEEAIEKRRVLADSPIVTKKGERIDPDGIIVGGEGAVSAGVLSRRSEIKRLSQEMVNVEGIIREKQHQHAQVFEELNAVVNGIKALMREKESLQNTLAAISLRRESIAGDIQSLEEEKTVSLEDITSIDAESAELTARKEALQKELGDLETQNKHIDEEITELQNTHNDLFAHVRRLNEELTELRLTQVKREEQLGAHKSKIDNIAHLIEERISRLDEMRQAQKGSKQKLDQTYEDIKESQRQLNECIAKRETLKEEIEQAQAAYDEKMASLESLGENKKALIMQSRQFEEEINAMKMDIREMELNITNLENRVRDDFGKEIDALASEIDPAEVDWNDVAEEIEQLKGKIDRVGNVNLDAIDEQNQLETRLAFLQTQQKDLLDAKNTLENTIVKINTLSKELFETTFTSVRDNFREMFRRLFGGGRADIILEDENDLLNTGIEIMAKPPGKEPRSVNLLSGGEKTLTIIALIFALFKSKPSPFCVLDEVDAALDEANIHRFTALLAEFLHSCQFLIITHSKKTMANAGILYGLTMKEPGISQKIEVRLQQEDPVLA